MRRLLSLLRDAEEGALIDPQPSLSRLDTLVEQLRASGLNVELSVTGPAATVPPGVDLSAYRIIQEALTNVLKHAGPRASVRVDVVRGTESLTITVSDDGRGEINGAARTAGHGLLGIRERVAVIGGRVEAGPDEAGGFVVRAQLPYAVEA
jgi:signal transduction histidine kinase